MRRCCVATRRASAPTGDEDRDPAVGLLLVLGVRRERLHRAGPPLLALRALLELADARVERLAAVLDRHRLRVGLEVPVPDGVLRPPALGGDERVLAVVLDAHERGL